MYALAVARPSRAAIPRLLVSIQSRHLQASLSGECRLKRFTRKAAMTSYDRGAHCCDCTINASTHCSTRSPKTARAAGSQRLPRHFPLLLRLHPRKDLLDHRSPRKLHHLVPVRTEQPALEERRNVVDLQLFRPRFELVHRDLHLWRVVSTLMPVQLDFLLDDLAQEERDEFLVVGCLVDVFPESLGVSSSPLRIAG